MAGEWRLKVPFLNSGLTLGVFGWILGIPGLTMGAHWVPLGYIGAAGIAFGNCKLYFGRAWEFFDSILRSLGVTLDASGIQN